MARTPRSDPPGSWHHVMNRGIARRPLFVHQQDMQRFGDLLGEATERGELEVHAFSLLSTHFHLLVRSPRGELGVGMQRVQTDYSRWFNRGRKRDGSLVRGRYRAKRIDDYEYQRAVLRYIDRNPVDARLVRCAADYRYGSAREYAGRPGPRTPWLRRDWVEQRVRSVMGKSVYDPLDYGRVFGDLPDGLARVVESRWNSGQESDPWVGLLDTAPAVVRERLVRRAMLADGVRPGPAVLDLETLELAVAAVAVGPASAWRIGNRDAWSLVRSGLARELCAVSFAELATWRGLSKAATVRHVAKHRELLTNDAEYADRATQVTVQALQVWKR